MITEHSLVIRSLIAIVSEEIVDESLTANQKASQVEVFPLLEYFCHMRE